MRRWAVWGAGSATWAAVVVATLGVAASLEGQDLTERVGRAPAGPVAFELEVRDDVEVCDAGLRVGDSRFQWRGRWSDRDDACGPGPARVVVERNRDGRITDLDVTRAGADRGRGGSELGPVGPAEAESFLLGLARTDARDDAVGAGMMLATIARDVDPAPELLELARDRDLRTEARRSALFWVSQVAAARIGPHLAGIAADEAEDQEVRDAAVFSLSQLSTDESVPALMELARSAPHAQTRRTALFWLAQADDPRVPEFFAEIILGRGG
jgi:hypothetical protein